MRSGHCSAHPKVIVVSMQKWDDKHNDQCVASTTWTKKAKSLSGINYARDIAAHDLYRVTCRYLSILKVKKYCWTAKCLFSSLFLLHQILLPRDWLSMTSVTKQQLPWTASHLHLTQALPYLSPTQTMLWQLAHNKLNAASNTANHILAPALSSSAGEHSTWASVCSLGQVVECDNPPTQDISTHKAPTFPASPAAQLSALPTQWHASLDRLSPAIDVSWASNNSVCNNGVYSNNGGLITQHGSHVPSASSWDGSHRISFAHS